MKCVLDKIIVEPHKEDNKKELESGIVLIEGEESMNKKSSWGTILAHGNGREGNLMHESIKVGATICFPKFAGHSVVSNGKDIRVLIQSDVLFVE